MIRSVSFSFLFVIIFLLRERTWPIVSAIRLRRVCIVEYESRIRDYDRSSRGLYEISTRIILVARISDNFFSNRSYSTAEIKMITEELFPARTRVRDIAPLFPTLICKQHVCSIFSIRYVTIESQENKKEWDRL